MRSAVCLLAWAVAWGSGETHRESDRCERDPQIAFEPNVGQTASAVHFLARCNGGICFLTSEGATFRTAGGVFRMRLEKARVHPAHGEGLLSGCSNYLVGDDASKWVRNVPHYTSVRCDGAMAGVDVVYRSEGRRLAYDLHLAPGVDADAIRWTFEGVDQVVIGSGGRLELAIPGGRATFSAPIAWQERDGRRAPVDAAYVVSADRRVCFRLGAHDVTRAVVIDPTLSFSTYLGGNAVEYQYGTAADASGGVYVAGVTYSSDFPTSAGAYQTSKGGTSNSVQIAYVTKFANSRSTLSYSTYLGGTSSEAAYSVAVDSWGAAYVGGFTGSSNFPLVNPYQSTGGGFLAKLNASGNNLLWSTRITGSTVNAVGLDSSSDVYAMVGGSSGHVMKFNSAGTTRAYDNTSLTNGNNINNLNDMAVDPSGVVWIVGDTNQPNNATFGAYQSTYAGAGDGWIVKLDAGGNRSYATYLGGSSADNLRSVALDSLGNVHVAGITGSTDFPVLNAYQATNAGSIDMVVAKFDPNATSLRWATYLGSSGSSTDAATSIGVTSAGEVLVGGYTTGSAFPTLNAPQSTFGGGSFDGVLVELSCAGGLSRSTYIGGSGDDEVDDLVLSGGLAICVGQTTSSDFPTVSSYQASLSGTRDAFVVGAATGSSVFTDTSLAMLQQATVQRPYASQLTITGGVAPLSWGLEQGPLPDGLSLASNGMLSGTPTIAGTMSFFVNVADANKACVLREYRVTVNPAPSVGTVTLPASTIGQGYAIPVPVTGGTAPFTWSLTSGVLPAGVLFDAGGVLSSLSLPQAGTISFGVQALDARGAAANGTVSLTVHAAPHVTSGAWAPCTQFRSYQFDFTVADGTAPFTWSIASGTNPMDKPIDADSGRLSGRTRAAGDYTFVVRATDVAGAVAEQSVSFTVNSTPTLLSKVIPWAAKERPYSAVVVPVAGTPPLAVSFVEGSFPTGVGISQSGTFFGTPTAAGRFAFTLRCFDSCGATSDIPMVLDVADSVRFSRTGEKAKFDFTETGLLDPAMQHLELLAGTSLSFDVFVKGKGALPVGVQLLDDAQDEIDLSAFATSSTGRIRVRKLPIAKSGRYFLRITPLAPFDGLVQVSCSAKAQTKWTGALTVDPTLGAQTIRFSALPGSKVALSVVSVKGGAAVPTITSLTDAAGNELLVATERRESDHGATLHPKVALTGGDYVATIAPRAGGTGDVMWTVSLKSPKVYGLQLVDVPAGSGGL